jgi:hypothetical protein
MVDHATSIVNPERKFPGEPIKRVALQLRTGELDTSRGMSPRDPR